VKEILISSKTIPAKKIRHMEAKVPRWLADTDNDAKGIIWI
jgi:hypothetical protein